MEGSGRQSRLCAGTNALSVVRLTRGKEGEGQGRCFFGLSVQGSVTPVRVPGPSTIARPCRESMRSESSVTTVYGFETS